jgi:hypothetical protein
MPAVPGRRGAPRDPAPAFTQALDAFERMRARDDAVLHDALASTCDTALNASDAFGDGDQKPLLNVMNSHPLRQLWSSSGDLFEKLDASPCAMSPFWVACFNGDKDAVRRAVDDARKADMNSTHAEILSSETPEGVSPLTRLLEKRESNLRYPPLHAVVAGARCLARHAPIASFVETASVLVAAGARVDSRDVAGHTALAKCTNGVDTPNACLLMALEVLGPQTRGPQPGKQVRGDADRRRRAERERRVPFRSARARRGSVSGRRARASAR